MYPVAPACLILFPKRILVFSLLMTGFARRTEIARVRERSLATTNNRYRKSSAFENSLVARDCSLLPHSFTLYVAHPRSLHCISAAPAALDRYLAA